MKATSISVGTVYRLVDSVRVRVTEKQPKSRYDHYQNFKVEYLDKPESLPPERRTGIVPSREFYREWGPEDEEGRRQQKKREEEQQAAREESEATQHELEKAGFVTSVRFISHNDRYMITFEDRESFDKMLDLLLERNSVANA